MSIPEEYFIFKGNVEMRAACSEGTWVCVFEVCCCLNRGLSRISRIARILRVHLFVVAQFIAPFSESRIFTDYADDADYLFSESRITQMTRIGNLSSAICNA